MGKGYGVLVGATAAVVLTTPLWHDGGSAAERSLMQRLESLALPTATAAVVAPLAATNATRDMSDHVDTAGLLMAGTTLFGLAAAVRRVL
jgi:hypothetical protein